jgi:hypothetical protein
MLGVSLLASKKSGSTCQALIYPFGTFIERQHDDIAFVLGSF